MTRVVSPTELRAMAEPLHDALAGLDVGYVTAREAPGLWMALEDIRRRVAGAQLLLARRVDESTAPADEGLRGAGEWIARHSGCAVSAGRDQVRASKQLEDLPVVAAAVRRGGLSTPQAEVIADAASADPQAQESLVGMASEMSLKELRDACGRIKAAADPDPERTYARIHRERRLRRFRGSDGAWGLSARGPIDAGAEFGTVLDAITDEVFREAYTNGARESREAYAFDALLEMSRRAWRDMHGDHIDTAAADGSPETPGPTSPRARRRKRAGVNPRHRMLVRIDHSALVRGYTEGDEICEIAGAGPVPVSVARRILGEAALHLVITRGVDVVNVTYLGRGPNAAQRIALQWLGLECSRLGCQRLATQFDHRDPFARCRRTELGNLDGLCGHDHDLKTRQGWALAPGTGKREMVPPSDPRHPGDPTFHQRRHKPMAA